MGVLWPGSFQGMSLWSTCLGVKPATLNPRFRLIGTLRGEGVGGRNTYKKDLIPP